MKTIAETCIDRIGTGLYYQSYSYERTDVSVELESNNHSVFLLCYHLVLVVKYRRKVTDDAMPNRLKRYIESQGERQ